MGIVLTIAALALPAAGPTNFDLVMQCSVGMTVGANALGQYNGNPDDQKAMAKLAQVTRQLLVNTASTRGMTGEQVQIEIDRRGQAIFDQANAIDDSRTAFALLQRHIEEGMAACHSVDADIKRFQAGL